MTYAEQLGRHPPRGRGDADRRRRAVGRQPRHRRRSPPRTRGGTRWTRPPRGPGERYWRIPLIQDYMPEMDSWYGDIQNTGTPGRARSSRAACSSSSSGPCRGPTSTSAAPAYFRKATPYAPRGATGRDARDARGAGPGRRERRADRARAVRSTRGRVNRPGTVDCGRADAHRHRARRSLGRRLGVRRGPDRRALARARRRQRAPDRLADGRRRRHRDALALGGLTLRFAEPVPAVVFGAYLVALVAAAGDGPRPAAAAGRDHAAGDPVSRSSTTLLGRQPAGRRRPSCRSRSSWRSPSRRCCTCSSMPFGAGAFGMGDVKLLVSVGLLAGPIRLFTGVVYGALLAGVVIVVLLVARRITLKTLRPVRAVPDLRGDLGDPRRPVTPARRGPRRPGPAPPRDRAPRWSALARAGTLRTRSRSVVVSGVPSGDGAVSGGRTPFAPPSRSQRRARHETLARDEDA